MNIGYKVKFTEYKGKKGQGDVVLRYFGKVGEVITVDFESEFPYEVRFDDGEEFWFYNGELEVVE